VSVVFDEQPLIQSLLDMLVSHSVTLQTQGNLKAVTQKVANVSSFATVRGTVFNLNNVSVSYKIHRVSSLSLMYPFN
jgi:hypothetical protein